MPTRSRWLHAALLAVGLSAALALSERSTGFTVDEGSYAIQAESLREGSWAIDWPFRSVDPEARHFPYHGGTVSDDAEYAYVSHPAWPVALAGVTEVVPEQVGLRLPSMLAVVAAALAGWSLAIALGAPAAAPWAFWVVAASPLLPDGLMAWAHAPAAALAGWALVALVRIVQGRARWWWWAVLVGMAGAGVLVRSESLLFAAALAAVAGLLGVWRRDPRLVGAAALVGSVGAGAKLLERAWTSSIVGEGSNDLTSRAGREDAWLIGRLRGAGTALIDGAGSSDAATLCSLAALVCIGAAAVRVVRPTSSSRPGLLLWAAAALTIVRLVVASDDPVPGLLAAWPVALLALLALREAPLAGRAAAAVVVVFTGAVLLTQYDDGGGLQWGGRYLAPVIVPVAALAALAVVRHLPALLDRRAVVALLAAGALGSLVITDQVRQGNADGMGAVAGVATAVNTDVVLVAGDQLARLDWGGWPERCWLAVVDGDVRSALEVLQAAGGLTTAYLGFREDALEAAGVVAEPIRPGAIIGSLPGGGMFIDSRANSCSMLQASR